MNKYLGLRYQSNFFYITKLICGLLWFKGMKIIQHISTFRDILIENKKLFISIFPKCLEKLIINNTVILLPVIKILVLEIRSFSNLKYESNMMPSKDFISNSWLNLGGDKHIPPPQPALPTSLIPSIRKKIREDWECLVSLLPCPPSLSLDPM